MSPGSILITGREHYFNSREEMLSCLGVNESSATLIECNEEFSEDEMRQYLTAISSTITVPKWIPRRPLVCQILNRLEPESLSDIVKDETGEIGLWRTLISTVCDREAKINAALDATVIRRVLCRLATVSRTKPGNVGPLTIVEINKTFEEAAGFPPVDESAAMLQRLPLLGRIGSESTDRQFVDDYFLDGLRADDATYAMFINDTSAAEQEWTQPLRDFGVRIVADEISIAADVTAVFRMLTTCAQRRNRVFAGDLLSAFLVASDDLMDFGGLILDNAVITFLNLAGPVAKNLTITNSIIERVDLSETAVVNVTLSGCLVRFIEGVAESKGVPTWIDNCEVEEFRSVGTVARIKKAPLTDEQRVLVTIIKKTFFQPGSGRKVEALLRGLGQIVDRGRLVKILNLLVREGVLESFKGKDGTVYSPVRSQTKRMETIVNQLTLSEDSIWKAMR